MTRKTGYRRALGQGMTEYIIIVALIAMAAIGVYNLFGQSVELSAKKAAGEIQGAQTAAKRDSGEATAKKGMGDYSVNK